MAQTISLQPNEKLRGITKDHHVRKQNGEHRAYICEDRTRNHILLSQKISLLTEHINSIVTDPYERVSVPALYQLTHNGRNGGYSKLRWKLLPYALDEATAAFEATRSEFQHATLIGSRECFKL